MVASRTGIEFVGCGAILGNKKAPRRAPCEQLLSVALHRETNTAEKCDIAVVVDGSFSFERYIFMDGIETCYAIRPSTALDAIVGGEDVRFQLVACKISQGKSGVDSVIADRLIKAAARGARASVNTSNMRYDVQILLE